MPASHSGAGFEEMPLQGVLLGIDHGVQRIGVAVTDAAQTLAMPLETIVVRTPALTSARIQQLVRDYRAVGLVIGLPLHMSGEEGVQAARVREFGEWLRRETGLPVAYWDERLSTSAAEALLWSRGESPRKQSGRLDGLAAQVLLEGYLRHRRAV
uniref:Putative pre-16S rRNA nuclease n=1 Tax=Schlesneria paludicola TaxID=360056 RepID=A0A7C4QUJ7_9PLAN